MVNCDRELISTIVTVPPQYLFPNFNTRDGTQGNTRDTESLQTYYYCLKISVTLDCHVVNGK